MSNVSFPKIPFPKDSSSQVKNIDSPDSNVEMENVYQQFDKYASFNLYALFYLLVKLFY